MKVAIIITTPDFAGLNIKENLLQNYVFTTANSSFENCEVLQLKENPNIKIYTTDTKCVYCEDFDKQINADLFIFPTTHRSEAGVASLSVHAPGNWGKAELGGRDKQLVPANAAILKQLFIELNKNSNGYETTLECTHHGPNNLKPTAFIEIGTSEKQWKDKKIGKVIATTIMTTLLNNKNNNYQIAFAIGGPHYMPNFKEIVLNTNIAVGHCCPKYSLPDLDEEMVRQAIEKTIPKVDFTLIDWKGLGAEKQRIIELLEKLGIQYKKTKDTI